MVQERRLAAAAAQDWLWHVYSNISSPCCHAKVVCCYLRLCFKHYEKPGSVHVLHTLVTIIKCIPPTCLLLLLLLLQSSLSRLSFNFFVILFFFLSRSLSLRFVRPKFKYSMCLSNGMSSSLSFKHILSKYIGWLNHLKRYMDERYAIHTIKMK